MSSEIKVVSHTLDTVGKKFDELKVLLDKSPKAYSLKYSDQNGYQLIIDFDLVKLPSDLEDSNDL